MTVRQEEVDDYRAVYAVNEEAFGQKDESELIQRIRNGSSFIPELSLIAEAEGRVVGHILFSKVRIEGEVDFETIALAPMAVLPEFQNRGIGGSLITEGLKKARELGFTSVIVLGHTEYYPRFGFEKASRWGISCPFEVPDEAFMALELVAGSLSGRAGTVAYPEEFGV